MSIYTPIISFLVYAIMLMVLYIAKFGIGLSADPAVWGQLGDFLGGSSAAFVSLLAILYAISSFRQQSLDSKRVQFESNLFELLRVRRELLESLQRRGKEGHEVISILINHIARPYLDNRHIKSTQDAKLLFLIEIYESYYKEVEMEIGHILRNIYNIYLYIENFSKEEEIQYYYARFLRSQLTAHEIILVGLNGLSKAGQSSQKFIEKYAMLNNLGSDNLEVVAEWRQLLALKYKPSAFGR